MTKILQAKQQLEKLGFCCVPCTPKSKECHIKNWSEREFTDGDFAQDANIAVRLGTSIVDVDLDSDEAVKLANYVLPQTGCIWGRDSRPKSHRLYLVKVDKGRSFVFSSTLLEVRTGKHLTIAPGSTHPSGEGVKFYSEGSPTEVDAVTLQTRCAVLAVAVVVAREVWAKGNHHSSALGLAGFLAKAGITKMLAQETLRGLTAELQPKADLNDTMACVETTYAALANQGPIAGIKLLQEAGLSREAAQTISQWLPVSSAAAPNAASSASAAAAWNECCTTVGEFVGRDFPPKEALIEQLLMSHDAALIYGLPGHGKTLVCLCMADALTRGGQFGSLSVACKRSVLFVDGEMSGADLKQQLIKMGISPEIHVVASVDLQAGSAVPDIANSGQQEALMGLIQSRKVEVVFFDNLFSLTQIEEFMSNDDPGFASLANFASRLRNAGVTVVFVHHGSKSGKWAMGATRLTAPMDLVISVKREDAVVTMQFEKHRSRSKPKDIQLMIAAGESGIVLADAGNLATTASNERELLVLSEVGKNSSIRKIAEHLNLSKETVSAVLKTLTEKGDVVKTKACPNSPYKVTPQGSKRLAFAAKGLVC